MTVKKFELPPLYVNTYLVISGDEKTALVIDPGVPDQAFNEAVRGLEIPYIVNTHGHFDHIAGNQPIKKAYHSQIVVHRADAGMLTDPGNSLPGYGIKPIEYGAPDILIEKEKETIRAGDLEFQVLFFPGHTGGCMALYSEKDKVMFAGDFIFANSIGRTDFPGGSWEQMRESLLKIKDYPDDILVYPGHDREFYLRDFQRVLQFFLK
jgi:hydroxyacylglutathione hydrolase